jgi:hypothetical protein
LSSSYRGLVLAGRYRLEERLHTNPDGVVWRAVDSTLDRKVSVRVMRPGHPFAADVADAARRAALIDDPRLVRVLDVGSDGDAGFVVSEFLDGDTLATLVERSPLSAPAVRRIIGEVAQGLDVAAGRGLHHLRLTPRSVIVCRDGTVKISGTAVEAAAAGLEPDHAATASRVDAVALVALLYSGLTGRWPLGDAGFPPAPRGEGGAPVPPADLVPAVPNDLDTLCVVTLGTHDDGPRTPAELVEELTPWLSAEEAPLRAAPRRFPSEAATAAPNPALKMRSPKRSTAARAGRPVTAFAATEATEAAAASSSTEAAEPPAPVERFSVFNSTEPTEPGAEEGPAAEAAPPAPPVVPRRSASLFPTPSVAATGSLPMPPRPEASRRMDNLFTDHPARPAETPAPAPAPAPKAKPRKAEPKKNSARPQPNSSPAYSGARAAAEEPLVPWGAGLTNGAGAPARMESTGPFPIVISPEAPPREQSRIVLFSVLGALILLLVVAAFSLRNFGSTGSDNVSSKTGLSPLQTAPVTPTPTPAATTAEPTPTPTVTPTPSATPAVPPSISSVIAIDPQGDGSENGEDAHLAGDGNASTFWKSDTYRSAQFGGLKKGVGLVLKLKKPAIVTSATIDVRGVGGVVELRTASGPDLGSSKVVGKATINNGQVKVKADGAVRSKYVILWFTKLPSVDGNFKAQVSEVRLK